MTVATPVEHFQHQGFGLHGHTLGRRIGIITAFLVGDLASFMLADVLLHLFATPPAIALFRNRSKGGPAVIDLLFIIALVFVSARYLVGDYSRRQLFWDGARATTGALLISGTAYIFAVVMLEPSSVALALAVWLGLLFLLPGVRQIMRVFLGRAGLWHLPTAIIGTNPTAQEVFPVLRKQLALGLDVRWVIPEHPEKHIPEALASLTPILAKPTYLTDALLQAGCRQVVVAPDDQMQMGQVDLIDQMIGADIAVAIVPSLRRLPLFGLSTNYFFGKDFLLLQVRNNLARLPQRLIKRTMDVVGAALMVVVLAPVLLSIALAIKAEDGGPILFIQKRVGHRGRDFNCLKFRTMVVDAEEQLQRWAHENPLLLDSYRQSNFKLRADPRVTRVGCWLRGKSLDELPQLINVLRGEMSLVGPRPLLRRELPEYGAVISLYERVRPGITGLWQISGRSHTTFAERVSYDEWYVKNWTVWYDVVIALQTAWVLFRGSSGAY